MKPTGKEILTLLLKAAVLLGVFALAAWVGVSLCAASMCL